MDKEIVNHKGKIYSVDHEECNLEEIKIIETKHPIMKLIGENKEILRFEPNGEIFIHGKLVTNDIEVVEGFREFLKQQGV